MQLRSRPSEIHCPFCREQFVAADRELRCRDCQAQHHLGCLGESQARRCGVCGGKVAARSRRWADDWRSVAAGELTQAEAVTRQRDIEVSRIWVYLLGFVGFLAFPLLTLSMSPGGWSYGAVLGFLGLEGAVLVGLIRAESPRRRLRRKPIGDPRSQKPPAKSAPFSMASKSKA